ncbi:hypothetical protein RJT34_25515 [Clitoria ternatea]|uniref:Uncharacterized protein n=1 Tax=Clitoria ternatea TaxID=43366 RepID=A0AAN9ILG1_CLITE
MIAKRCLFGFLFYACLMPMAVSTKCPSPIECGYLGNFTFPFTSSQHPDCGILVIHGCDDYDSMANKSIKSDTMDHSDAETVVAVTDPSTTNSYPQGCSVLQLPTSNSHTLQSVPDNMRFFNILTADVSIEINLSPECSTCYDIHGGLCRLDGTGKFYCDLGKSPKTKVKVAAVASVAGALGILTVQSVPFSLVLDQCGARCVELVLLVSAEDGKNCPSSFRCNPSLIVPLPKAYHKYSNCSPYDIYYGPTNTETIPNFKWPTSLAPCSTIQVGIVSEPTTNNPFEFLSGELAIEVQLSDDCEKCLRHPRGQCQLDTKRKFYCVNESQRRGWLVKVTLGLALEMAGGRKNIKVDVDCSSEIYFPHWIYNRLEVNEKIDLHNIRNKSDDKTMRKMTIVGLWCIQTHPSARPSITKVVEMLEGEVELLQMPPKPFLSSPSTSPVHLSCETL